MRISVQTSRCHSDTIRLEIISSKPHLTPDKELFQQSSLLLKSDLVKEVTRSVEEAQLAQEVQVNITEDYKKYCQTKGRSLYTLLEEIRDLALLDVSNSYGIWNSSDFIKRELCLTWMFYLLLNIKVKFSVPFSATQSLIGAGEGGQRARLGRYFTYSWNVFLSLSCIKVQLDHYGKWFFRDTGSLNPGSAKQVASLVNKPRIDFWLACLKSVLLLH